MPIAQTMTVLVVDDQVTIRALVRDGLEQLGITGIVEAEDGEQGLRAMLTGTPAPMLIISDYNMPNFDGLSLLRAVRMHPPTKGTPFIMLTGRADKELVMSAAKYGVNNYLAKPFTVEILREKIEAVVGALT